MVPRARAADGPKLEGLTVATEVEFCGGFQASAMFLAALDEAMFDGTLEGSEVRWAKKRNQR